MGKALKVAGTVIVGAGLALATGGAALIPAAAGGGLAGAFGTAAFGITASTLLQVGSLVSGLGSALDKPKVGNTGNPTNWTADPDAPIPFPAGRVGTAGTIVHREVFGPDNMYEGFVTVVAGAGPIQSFQTFTGDDQAVTFDGTGKANSSQWSGEMWMKTSLGAQPSTALVSPTGLKNSATLPGWGSAYKLSGKAAYMVVLGENSKHTAYATGEPKPLWVIEGLFGWDPRQDSTYPGGSGACRLNDPATWVYLTNPILWGLKWALGLWEGPTGKGAPQVDYQVGGIGAKVEGIDVAAFVDAANIADANSWTVAAYPTTDDDKAQVLDGFLQAGGAIYAQKAGRISCIQRAAPRTSIVTISASDTAGPLEIATAASRVNRINTLRPRFWSEANRWQMTPIDEITSSTYQTEDGGKRTRPVDFPYVPNAVQCGQLAALQIANTREGIAGVIPLKPHLQRITPGDAFTITEPGFVLDGLKCLCLNTEYDPATGVHRVSFASETDAKYPFALGQSPDAPVSPSLTPVDPRPATPDAADWTVVVRPADASGTQQPGLRVTGTVGNATVPAVLVAHGPSNTGPWTPYYSGPPTAETIDILGLEPGTTRYVAITYVSRSGVPSLPLVKGPYTVPALIGSNDAAVLAALARIASDSWLTIGEKPDVIREYQEISADHSSLVTEAALLGVNSTAFNTAVTALGTYLGGLSPAWNSLSADTPIVGATFLSKFTDVYSTRAALREALTAKVGADAAAALAALARIASDNWLTKGEKLTVIQDWAAVLAEYAGLMGTSASLGITTERTAYDSAANALGTYLGGLSPAWNDTTQDTAITGTTFVTKWSDYYAAKTTLQSAMSATGGGAVRNSYVDFTGYIGRAVAEAGVALSSTMAVPASGSFVIRVTGVTTSDFDGGIVSAPGTFKLYVNEGGSYTLLATSFCSAQSIDTLPFPTFLFNRPNSYAGNVFFALNAVGGGGGSASHGTVEGVLEVTYFP